MAGYIGKSQGVVLTDIDNDSVTTADIQDNAITADKLNVTGSGTSGQALTSDADGSFSWTTIASDLVDDTTPQLGGDLDGNGNTIDLSGSTDAISLPKGTTAQRPSSPTEGELRYNSTTKGVEFYNGSAWASISAVAPSPIQANNNTWFYMNMSDSSSVSGSTIVNTATGTSAISDTLPLVSGASRSSGAGSFILQHTTERQDLRRDIGGDPFAPATHGISMGTLFFQAHGPSADRGLILYGDDGTDNHLFVRVHFQADNSISVGEDTNSSDVWTQTDTGITSGSWYFWVVTIATDGTMHTSLNGASKVLKRSGGTAPTPGNAHFGLLGDLYNDNASQFNYATAFWYKGVLTDQQISDEYNYLNSVWTGTGLS